MSQGQITQTIQKDLPFLEIKSVTWNKDSHGLFDYENKHLQVKKSELHSASKLYRSAQEIEIFSGPYEQWAKMADQLQYLSSIEIRKDQANKDNFTLVSQNNNNSLEGLQQQVGEKAEEAFVIVRSFKNRDGSPQLKAGDIIKLGRIEYSVIEIRKSDLTISQNPIRNFFIAPEKYRFNLEELKKETKGKVCRICLDELLPEQTTLTHPLDNLLLATCNCRGSCEYSHYLCLKNWIESKVAKRAQANTIQYQFKRLECEVCKEPLPQTIIVDDQELNLIEIDRPQSPYIMLQSIVREKKTINGIFLMQLLPDDLIKMGRGHYCELRVSDISVSRFHAFIKNVNDEFYIFDNNSKFGTLILMEKEYKLSDKKVAIQIGRTVLSLVIKNQFMLKHATKDRLAAKEKLKSTEIKTDQQQQQEEDEDKQKHSIEVQVQVQSNPMEIEKESSNQIQEQEKKQQ